MTTTATAPRRTAHADLLAGYIAGSVTDDAMSQFDALAEDAATSDERQAFAQFFVDALQTGDLADVLPPATGTPAGAQA